MLQDILTKCNEVNCVDEKPVVKHRSHRDVRARVLVWPDRTVPVQWRGPPRISRSSWRRTSRSMTMCSGQTRSHDWTPSKWRTRRLCWSTERFTCRVYFSRSRSGWTARSRRCVEIHSYFNPSRALHNSTRRPLDGTTTRTSWRSATDAILPGHREHTGGSRQDTHGTPVLLIPSTAITTFVEILDDYDDFVSECVSFPRTINNPFWGLSPFFQRKVTLFIGRETKTHILHSKINEKSLWSAPPTIIVLLE